MAVHAPSMGAPTRAPFAPGNSPTSDDAAILEAFQRYQQAHHELVALPDDGKSYGGEDSPEQKALWAIIDRWDANIHAAPSITPEGIAPKLWLAIVHTDDSGAVEDAAIRGDLAWFEQQGDALNWSTRLIVSAIRALTDMTAQQTGEPCADRSIRKHAQNAPAQTPGTLQPSDFVPSAWLAEFEHVGGVYALTEAGLHLCVIPGDRSVEELHKARLLIAGLAPEDKAALADELRGRQVMEVCHGDH